MGIRIGYFDGNGDYVREYEPDVFVRNLDDVRVATYCEREEEEEEKVFSQNMNFVRLCSCLQDNETPTEALRRLGKSKNNNNKSNQSKKKSQRRKLAFERGRVMLDVL